MEITIIAVGKIKEAYFTKGIELFQKQIRKSCPCTIIQLEDEKTPDQASEAQELKIKATEGRRILQKIKEDAYVIALCIEGKKMTSKEFTKLLKNCKANGKREVVFIIGGSLGLSKEVVKRSDYQLSFSNMTFPHQMMRYILMEQLAYVING